VAVTKWGIAMSEIKHRTEGLTFMPTKLIRRYLTLLCLASAVYGQAVVTATVTDPRPLAKAAEQLESQLGVAINYEDAPYENAADISDVTASVVRGNHPGAKVLVPRGGPLALTAPITGADRSSDAAAVLAALVGAHRAAGYGGDFEVEFVNGMFYILPKGVMKKDGELASVSSVLAGRISLPYQEQKAINALNLVLSSVSTVAGSKIGLGSAPFGVLATRNVTIGASNEPARDVIARLFSAISDSSKEPKLAYHLYFDPLLRYYMLNMHEVVGRTTTGSPVVHPEVPPNVHYTRK
jgi:hypothetical protein